MDRTNGNRDDKRAWLSRSQMAAILGMHESGFDASPRKFAREDDIRREGRRVLFYAPAILERYFASRLSPMPPGDEAGLFTAADSPALERWRESKAKLAELEYEQKSGNLVARSDVRDSLSVIAARLRAFAETIQRHYGAQAVDLFDEALTDCERAMDTMYADDGDDDSDSPK